MKWMNTNGAELMQDGSGQSFPVSLCHTLMNQLDIMGPEEGCSDGCASSNADDASAIRSMMSGHDLDMET